MSNSRKPFTVEECLGDPTFASLSRAQADALPSLAADLTFTLRSLIAQGILGVEDGRIIVKNVRANKR
jgi:hypothetical protein